MDKLSEEPNTIDEAIKKLEILSIKPEDTNDKRQNSQEVDGSIQKECQDFILSSEGIIPKVDDTKQTTELEDFENPYSNSQELSDYNQALPNYYNQIDTIHQGNNELGKKANSNRINADPQVLSGLCLIKAEILPTEKCLGRPYSIKLQFINNQGIALHNISLKLAQSPNTTLMEYQQIGPYQSITQLLNIDRPTGEMIYQGGISFCGQSGEKVDFTAPYYAKISHLQFYDEGLCSVMVRNTSFIDLNQEHGMQIYIQGHPVANVQTLRPLDQKQEIIFAPSIQDSIIEIFLAEQINGQLCVISNTVKQNIDDETLFLWKIEQEVQSLQLPDYKKWLYKYACKKFKIFENLNQRQELIKNFYKCLTVKDCLTYVVSIQSDKMPLNHSPEKKQEGSSFPPYVQENSHNIHTMDYQTQQHRDHPLQQIISHFEFTWENTQGLDNLLLFEKITRAFLAVYLKLEHIIIVQRKSVSDIN